MIRVGEYNTLRVVKHTAHGLFLIDEADESEEILLPKNFAPEQIDDGDYIKVFIYRDSLNRITATTQTPFFILNEFAYLEVKQLTQVGAFLEWGLEKDLMVPFREQGMRMELGEFYMVYLYLDEYTDRLVATSKINRYFEKEQVEVEVGEKVDLLIWKRTDLGVKVIVNQRYQGLIFHNELFQDIEPGDQMQGYVKTIREHGKLDISLEPLGHLSIEPNAAKVLERIKDGNGFLDLNDKSDPEEIKRRMGMSKKAFKKAVGTLYRKKLIRIESSGLFLFVKTSQN